MGNNRITQAVLVTDQTAMDPAQVSQPIAFFDVDGNPVDLVSLISALDARVTALETP